MKHPACASWCIASCSVADGRRARERHLRAQRHTRDCQLAGGIPLQVTDRLVDVAVHN